MSAAALGVIGLLLVSTAGVGAWVVVRRKGLDRWLGSYLRSLMRPRQSVAGVTDVLVCIADHYEPACYGADLARQRARVDAWVEKLPKLADRHRDSHGRPLQYTFFYPAEEYHPEHLDRLAELCRAGYGDVEVHLHHDDDTSSGLRATLLAFTNTLFGRHGLLRRERSTGLIRYAFIHGNWALDNSRRDGRWCGVNDELSVLRETGCYADFTLPAAPEDAQTPTINSIYYATDDPQRPRSHDRGRAARAGQEGVGDLLIVQGPLTLNWRDRVRGVLPRIENGEMSPDNPPTPLRADLWVEQRVHVEGRPEWVFVKLHTHGAEEGHARALLDGPLDRTLSYLESRYNDGARYRLHYVTAWEMFNVIRAAEAGATGDPHLHLRSVDHMFHSSGATEGSRYGSR